MARIADSMGLLFLVATACITMSARLSAGQVAAPAPGADCTSDLLELFPCLDYLTNSSVSTVAPICCSALTNVSTSSPFCLCQLISPSYSNQSAQLGINNTRALLLPGLCSLGLSSSSCAAILGPAAAPAPLALVPVSAPVPISIVPVSAPVPISIVPSPAFSPLAAVTPVSAPIAGAPVSSPESSPGPPVDCSIEIETLTGCLTFLSGNVTTPSPSCCTNLGTIVSTAPQCLCALAESPAISTVNATLVQILPSLCGASVSLGDCANVGAPSSTNQIGSAGPGNYGAKSAGSPNVYMVIALGFAAFAHALLQSDVQHIYI